ncbi:MAG: hypothetical protein C7B47_06845 [Sulfobacillus thermosulfidooxidans]|uniref:Major facilitator superfamily (MFS) profile domain-containing protein n=1 Tax=Sulfobacillus thermosulfidooxidans TaxID=28034 RepID=A0A2T2X0H7_SULTH|nr:MAG: hypothetical protein C7B47_06845 [Sulfobacillus thermosulfidooxidans]
MNAYRRLITNRLFVIYWGGATLVQLALQFVTIALAWFVLEITGSAVRVAVILAVIPVAHMATSSWIGHLMDRLPRRSLMILDNASQMLLYASVPVMTWMHVLTFPLLCAVVAMAAALSPLSMIGRGVLLPHLVSGDELVSANGLSQLRSSLVYLLGPVLGGLLVAFLGAPETLLVTAGCYGAYVGSLWAIPAEKYQAVADNQPLDPTMQTTPWHFLRQSTMLLIMSVVTLFFNLTYGPLEPALPVLVSRVFHAGASTLGWIWSSFAMGTVLGTLVWERLRPQWSLRVFIIGVIVGWGLFSGAVGLTTHPDQAMALMFCGGITYAPYNIVAATCQQRLIPDFMRGTVLGTIQSVTSAGLPMGQLLGGLVVSAVGARAAIVLGGTATVLLGGALMAVRIPWARLSTGCRSLRSTS